MATRPPRFRPRGSSTPRQADQRRGSARARGYTTQWDKASARHLLEHPVCVYCQAGIFGPARVVEATLVDHLFPHKGDRVLFWIEGWWVGSCTACHSGPKQALERRGLAFLNALAKRLGLPPKELAT